MFSFEIPSPEDYETFKHPKPRPEWLIRMIMRKWIKYYARKGDSSPKILKLRAPELNIVASLAEEAGWEAYIPTYQHNSVELVHPGDPAPKHTRKWKA